MNSVISIGYGRALFETQNHERARLAACAELVPHLHMIVFSRRSHGLQKTSVSDRLTLYPTNSISAIHCLIDAFLIARQLIKQNQPAVVVTTQDPFETALVGLSLKFFYRTKCIVQEHGDFFGLPHWRQESWLNRLRYLCGLGTLHYADAVRVVSKRTERTLMQHGIKHLFVLPVAIDGATFKTAAPVATIEELFGKDTFVLLSVARFVPQKNLTLLLKAFVKAYRENPKLRLLLIGDGPEAPLLKDFIARCTPEIQAAIKILPWSDNVAGFMKAASAYVLSSNYEGWGRVLIEALLSQVPIVTTAVGCAEEVVQHEVHGLVVPVGDSAALAAALVRLSTDTTVYTQIKHTLSLPRVIPGSDRELYNKHWVSIFQ